MSKFERGGSYGGKRDFGDRKFGGGNKFGGGSKFGGSRGGRDFGGPKTMHRANCAECGDECEVPFRPSGDRPVYCSQCFSAQGGGSDRSDRSERRSFDKPRHEERRGHQAVCDKCGENCEVPFRPTAGKPVFCSKCFDKGGSSANKDVNPMKEQMATLNAKLDKILSLLGSKAPKEIVSEKKNESKPEETTVVTEVTEEKEEKKAKKASAKAKTVTKKEAKKKK